MNEYLRNVPGVTTAGISQHQRVDLPVVDLAKQHLDRLRGLVLLQKAEENCELSLAILALVQRDS